MDAAVKFAYNIPRKAKSACYHAHRQAIPYGKISRKKGMNFKNPLSDLQNKTDR